MMTMKAAISAVMLAAMMLGGCTSFTPTTQLDDESSLVSSDQRNTYRLETNRWQGTSQVPMSHTEIGGADGISTFNSSNPGAASITPDGVSIASPNPTKADRIDYRSESVLRNDDGSIILTEEGLPFILTHSVSVVGFESKPELVIAENTRGIAVQMDTLNTLYQTNGEQYEQQISAIRAISEVAADAIDAGIRAMNPVPLP